MSIGALLKYLPYRFTKAIVSLPDDLTEKAFEIRLRCGAASSVSVKGRNVPFNEKGASKIENAMRATKEEMERCLMLLCGGSLYSHEQTLKEGFIPFDNGRAGICGNAVTDAHGNIIAFREIYSIDLRIHSEHNFFAQKLINHFASHGVGGTLIYAPPMLGKTTLLRSACYMLSCGIGIRPYRVGIVDEREEICIGDSFTGLSDVISGCGKAKAIELLTRTMAPEIIACDELSESESEKVSEAQNTGVSLIATSHAADLNMLMKRRFIKEMIERRIFVNTVMIKNDFEYEISVSG